MLRIWHKCASVSEYVCHAHVCDCRRMEKERERALITFKQTDRESVKLWICRADILHSIFKVNVKYVPLQTKLVCEQRLKLTRQTSIIWKVLVTKNSCVQYVPLFRLDQAWYNFGANQWPTPGSDSFCEGGSGTISSLSTAWWVGGEREIEREKETERERQT